MRSTFFGFDIAAKGLFVAQKQIDVTGHNIANTNTEGYTRQRFVTSAVEPGGAQNYFAPVSKGIVGGGAQTLSLDQIRDRFLDRQYRNQVSQAEYYAAKSDAMYYVEDVFNSTDENSLNGIMNSLFNAMQEIHKNPTDKPYRTNLVQQAKRMCDLMRTYDTQMKDLMYQQDDSVNELVKQANGLAAQVAQLNDKILQYEIGGNQANDLRDQRNLILDKLSGLMDVTYKEVSVGQKNIYGVELSTLVITIGDEELVNHDSYREIETVQDATNDVVDKVEQSLAAESFLRSIRFVDSGDELDIQSGSIKGHLDIRDGNSKETPGIPYFLEKIDTLVQAFVEQFNSVHMDGYTVPYTDDTGVFHDTETGIPFFDETGLTAATINLSEYVLDSEFNIAASANPVVMDEEGHFDTGNNEIAVRLINEVKNNQSIPVIGNVETYFTSFMGELASTTASTNQMSQTSDTLASSLDSQRQSVMGVNIDEEMTGLIRFQHAYSAASRALTTMDEMLDVLINRTGRVGL